MISYAKRCLLPIHFSNCVLRGWLDGTRSRSNKVGCIADVFILFWDIGFCTVKFVQSLNRWQKPFTAKEQIALQELLRVIRR